MLDFLLMEEYYITIGLKEWAKVHSFIFEPERGKHCNRSKMLWHGGSMSKRELYEKKTEELIMPFIEAEGFELVDVEYVKEGADWYLRVYIDKEGGITVNDCELISRAFNEVLDREDYIGDAYIFEVSSPGLLRPLKKDKDYERNIGNMLEIKLFAPHDGIKEKEFEAELLEYDRDSATFIMEDESKVTIKRSEISLIRPAIEF